MAGYGKGLGQHQNLDILSQQINYQTQYNMSYQHYLQQVQAYGQGLNKKVQDQQDLQFLSAVQWQQQHQEVWGVLFVELYLCPGCKGLWLILRELQWAWAKVGWLFGFSQFSVPEWKILLNEGKDFYIESFLQHQKALIYCK